MKNCSKCKIDKELTEFAKDKNQPDGLYSSCKPCKLNVNKTYYNNNLDKERKRGVIKYQANKDKYGKLVKTYQKANPAKRAHWKAKYRAAKLNATLPGFEKEILAKYEACPKGYHVDHIVPLQGETVSGLHVPWNLQIIPAAENLSKSNKF